MGEEVDWRLETREEQWMHGARLRWTRYSDESDHDHCALCWAKFTTRAHVEELNEGYFQSAENEWVCEPCFDDFTAYFGWVGDKT